MATEFEHPKSEEHDYAQKIKQRVNVAEKMARRAFADVKAVYGNRINRRAQRLRNDATPRQIEQAIRRAVRAASTSFFRVHNRKADRKIAQRAAQQVSEHNRRTVRDRLAKQLQIDAVPDRLPPQLLAGWVSTNVSKIQSVSREFFDGLEDELIEGLRDGERLEQIASRFEDAADGAKRHSELIARDQFGTLNAQVNRHRQQQIGISRYRWIDSGDGRVRDSHEDYDGEIYTWEDGNPDGEHPGEPPNCRCTPDPIVKDLTRNDSFWRHITVAEDR